MAEVDTSSRQGARKHHTATHLLQSALKQVLKEEGEISQQVLLKPHLIDFVWNLFLAG